MVWSRGNFPVNFETTGYTRVRLPLERALGDEKYLVLSAKLGRSDDMPWDDSLEHVLRLADKKSVAYVENTSLPTANRLIQFCLKPFSDASAPWALDVKSGKEWEGRPDAVVMAISDWPTVEQLKRLSDYVKGGRHGRFPVPTGD